MRGMRNIRWAKFAGTQVQIGEAFGVMYVKNLSGAGMWSQLQQQSDGKYKVILPNGKEIIDDDLEIISSV